MIVDYQQMQNKKQKGVLISKIGKLWKRVSETKTFLAIVMLAIGISGTVDYYEWKELKAEYDAAIEAYERVKEVRENKEVHGDAVSVLDTSTQVVPVAEAAEYSAADRPEQRELSKEVELEIRKVFGEDAEMAIAIAKAENVEMDPAREGDKHLICEPKLKQYCDRDGKQYGSSWGIYQIRFLPGRPEPLQLVDYKFNIQFAKQLFDRSGWNPWSTYAGGQYFKFLKK